MVRGLDIFRERFGDYSSRYVLIGGTACDLAMGEAGLEFRATKDLDIVLCIESLDKAFAEAFWAFVREGGYQIQETAEGNKQFYRFKKPKSENYPFMLELFSRVPDALTVGPGSHLTPIPTAEEVSSLSAILMDADYYGLIRSTSRILDGLPVVGPEGLIPLKARAWLDLTERKAKGEPIDSKDVKKHKNDVFRLYQIVDPEAALDVPDKVKMDMAEFVTRVASEGADLKSLGMPRANLEAILADLRRLYHIG